MSSTKETVDPRAAVEALCAPLLSVLGGVCEVTSQCLGAQRNLMCHREVSQSVLLYLAVLQGLRASKAYSLGSAGLCLLVFFIDCCVFRCYDVGIFANLQLEEG